MSIKKLKEVLVHREENPKETFGNWKKVEEKLQVQLPDNFKEFISAYGTGEIENHLIIFNPFAKNEMYNLIVQAKTLIVSYNYFKRKHPHDYPYTTYHEGRGLLPFGLTTEGDLLFWLINDNSKEWTIVVREQATGKFTQYNESLTEFLYKLIEKKISTNLLPKEFSSRKAYFSSEVF